MMDEKRLDEIEARAQAATPGPWHVHVGDTGDASTGWPSIHSDPSDKVVVFSQGFAVNDYTYSYTGQREAVANAMLAAHAREDVPALVAEVRRLREGLEDIAKRYESLPTVAARARRVLASCEDLTALTSI